MQEETDRRATDVRSRIATQLGTNFMVEAAAGTGKTTSLIARMLNLVAEGACAPEQMAAVTFTRKAAAELRERFQRELIAELKRLEECDDPQQVQRRQRLQAAATTLGQTFIGTIHSFCAIVIRQRPIEFGVNPGFREMEADENQLLMQRAWQENLADLQAQGDPLLSALQAFGLETSQLRECFQHFVDYRDVQQWPSDPTPDFDLEACKNATREYVEHMRHLVPHFPLERKNDKLMSRYELIVRAGNRAFDSEARFFRMLEHFDHRDETVQKQWHDTKVAKREKDRFVAFRSDVVQPALAYWRQRRYQTVVQFVRRALSVYERIKLSEGALDFTDLLLIAARGLREQPHLRSYFQQRFTHLLVDEFQDTDPIQAEAVILLGSDDVAQTDWQHCRLRPGALFIVGDPKQSIYRFRRGDIVTYNRVKTIFESSGGEVVSLVDNFRSSAELLAWNNEVFATRFPQKSDDYAPAHTAMRCGRPRTVRGALGGIYRLPVVGSSKQATDNEAESIARFIRHAISSGQTIERWSSASNAFELSPVRANDFLIITRNRPRIAVYKAALERHGVDCEVSGNNSFKDNPQLPVLRDILQAADDPYNPVHYLSLLRDRLFGFSDAELYELKRAGGTFLFTAELPAQLDTGLKLRFEACRKHLQTAQIWLRTLPPIVALEKIAQQFGLLAESAEGDDRNIALGSLLKAFEVLRTQSHQFDHAADLIEGIDQLLLIDEADSLRAMGNAHDAVRIMNLHKAKGLEAPIVFLADTWRPTDHDPAVHVSRHQDQPRGAMCIAMVTSKFGGKKPIAEPVGWEQMQAEEQRFLDAEANRLLYVATTRAANMMVVSVTGNPSPWSALQPFLNDAPGLPIPTDDQLAAFPAPPVTANSAATTADSPVGNKAHEEADPEVNWRLVQQPSYGLISVKKEALRGSRRPDWQADGEYGMTWGIALHELLEMASKSTTVDLHGQALNVAAEYDIATARVAELVETVRAVVESPIWQRSRAARRCYSELPFDVPSMRDGQPVIIRGVIDLIFEEPDGWVIVDYKSDSLSIDDIDSVCEYYRPQLAEYAHHWQTLTGLKVKEQGIYLTRLKSYHTTTA